MKIGFVHNQTLLRKIKFAGNVSQEIIIGRSASADVSLSEVSTLSSRHVQLFFDGSDQIFITDLNSTNGTYIDGTRIVPLKTYPISAASNIALAGSKGVQIVFNPDAYQQKSISHAGVSSVEYDVGSNSLNILQQLTTKDEIILGRGQHCDIILDYSFISREHASIRNNGGSSFIITDLNSLNGTFINGKRVKKAEFTSQDDIFLGRLKLSLRGHVRDLSNEVAIKVESIVKRFGNNKIGLHETSFEIPSKSLLAIMGPSGCGKSTLLKALNGDSPVTSGKVYIAGLELNQNFDFIKTQIGYVPQDDIVHRELTVAQSLRYTAKLRLNNWSEEQINQKIDAVLTRLNIQMIKESQVAKISGGQRKRVSIAVELLTDPMILFLDEPTSPLDPQTIENFLECIQQLARSGTTVIMVTHKPEDLEYMQSVIFMAEGGRMVYYGDANRDKYLNYFNVKNAPKIYSNLVDKSAEYWVTKFKQLNPENPNTKSRPQPIKSSQPTNYFSQYYWLTHRYFNIKLNDRVNSAIMVGQAPIIAILISIIFSEIGIAVPFLLTISALWFGVNNAAREIVAELPIYKRERMFNQGILPYIFSKLTVLTTFAAIQCIIFTVIMYLRYNNCDNEQNCVVWNNPSKTFLWMLFISVVSSLMGLLLSAIVTSTEKVMTLVPIVLIPQLMLAGIIAKINSKLVELISYFTISRWGTEGFSNIQQYVIETQSVPGKDNKLTPVSTKTNAIQYLQNVYHDSYKNKDMFGSLTGKLQLDFYCLALIGFLFFIFLFIALKKKDPLKIN